MLRHRRVALTVVALLAVALPAPVAFAQSFEQPPPDDSGVLGLGVPPPEPALQAGDAPADQAWISPSEPQGRRPSGVAERLAAWVTDTNDNGALAFLIVDKLGARIFAFDVDGGFLGSAPVLVGLARGDDSAPGIGDLKLAQIGADERTTPAGRFVAAFGASNGHGTMLWVDFPDAISLHPVMSVDPGEHRLQRIKSSDPEQHRISYGCINVPKSFYDGVVLTALAGGNAVVYVLPDTKPIAEVFPAFAADVGGDDALEPPDEQMGRGDQLSDAPDPIPDP